MKLKLPKVRLNLNLKPILNYLVIIITTSLFIASIFVALPLTEKYVTKATYNLNTKNSSYWSREYVIETEDTSSSAQDSLRDIMYKRLKGFGTEEVSTYKENGKVRIVVTSSKDKDLTDELITNRFEVQIMTRKSDVNFDDSNNTYAYMLATNYDATDWASEDFRDVYITKLKSTSGDYANFAIFKLWPSKLEQFNTFLQKYNGQYIGVSIDGYVTPHLVDSTSQLFAIPISTDDASQIKVISLLYNSGVINTSYNVTTQNDLVPNIPTVNYINLTIGIFVAIVLLYTYLFLTKQASQMTLLKSLLATTLTLSFYLSFLKLSQIPVDTFLLTIEGILAIVITMILSENKDSVFYLEITLLLILTAMIFLGNGYLSMLAQAMLILTALSKLCLIISGWYINKVRKI